MGDLSDLVSTFVESVASGRTEIYNEFSLQHEFGIFLRGKFPGHKVQFERNVAAFFESKAAFKKKEIDISVFSEDTHELKYAVELKFPRNGQYPEQMFKFCEDISFAEELGAAGFSTAGLLVFADDHLFYEGPTDGIYGYFRGGRALHGQIQKPTGKKDAVVTVRGSYSVKWKPISGPLMYAVIEVANG